MNRIVKSVMAARGTFPVVSSSISIRKASAIDWKRWLVGTRIDSRKSTIRGWKMEGDIYEQG